MMRIAIFVDAANMFYAQRENRWHIDYKRLLEYFLKDKEFSGAYYFTGTPFYQEPQKVKGYRNFKKLLIYAGYTVIDKEVKVIKGNELVWKILINEKTIEETVKEKKIDKDKIKLYNVEIELIKEFKDKRKANLDIEMVLKMVTTMNNYDCAILLGGDSDFVPIIEYLQNCGKKIICVGRRQSTALEIINISNEFIDLNDIKSNIVKRGSL